jgi:hypothetical protein
MAITLESVVPWGRSLIEYAAMFALSEDDLEKRFLDCGSGPASFNASLTKLGGHAISADPIYRFSSDELRVRINEAYEIIMEQVGRNRDDYVWNRISSVEELGRVRMHAMNDFLSDYDAGKGEGRYVDASLPILPFQDGEFDIALCSHLLFLYSEQLSLDFHLQSVKELCRVSSEVRIFPLMEFGIRESRHLDAVVDGLERMGIKVLTETVPYEFQKGGNQMLRITAR